MFVYAALCNAISTPSRSGIPLHTTASERQTAGTKEDDDGSEDADIIAYPLLLILRDAFCDPSDVPDLLLRRSATQQNRKLNTYAYLFPKLDPSIYNAMCELPCESDL